MKVLKLIFMVMVLNFVSASVCSQWVVSDSSEIESIDSTFCERPNAPFIDGTKVTGKVISGRYRLDSSFFAGLPSVTFQGENEPDIFNGLESIMNIIGDSVYFRDSILRVNFMDGDTIFYIDSYLDMDECDYYWFVMKNTLIRNEEEEPIGFTPFVAKKFYHYGEVIAFLRQENFH